MKPCRLKRLKTVRSTQKMSCNESALHIVSAQISELGITLASKSVAEKSNEIPAVQELIRELNIEGCLVTADALNCQRDTAKAIVERKGDYLLDAKANQPELMKAISEYFEVKSLWKDVSTKKIKEKNRNRIEIRTAYATADVDWMPQKGDWENLSCIGAIKTEFERNGEKAHNRYSPITKGEFLALKKSGNINHFAEGENKTHIAKYNMIYTSGFTTPITVDQ